MAAALHYGRIKLEASSGHLHVHSSNDLLFFCLGTLVAVESV